jgi:outer membrane protein assembly factor BamB
MVRLRKAARISPALLGALFGASFAAFPLQASAELVASPATPLGWRGDGSGRFPGALPATKWSETTNVVWKTPMPAATISHPVVVGEVIFTCAEPTTLLCVRRTDGRILWRRSHEFEDMLSADALEKRKENLATAAGIRRGHLRTVAHRLSEIRKELGQKSTDAAIRRQRADLEARMKSLQQRLAVLERYRPVPPHRTRGHSFATPVSDGRWVYVFFGNGMAAAYDLAGDRKWIRWVRRPTTDYAAAMSPVLAGRTLVLSINDSIIGLNVASGTDAWEIEARPRTGGFARGRVGDVDVVVTSRGDILRSSDGKRLIRMGFPARAHHNIPVLHDGLLYFLGEREHVLVQQLLSSAGGVSLKGVTAAMVTQGTYYASPLVHDGRVYVCERGGTLSVIDAKTGKWIGSKRLSFSGLVRSSPTLAGPYLVVADDSGQTAVLKPSYVRSLGGEPTFKLPEVARNRLEPCQGGPVFAGWHMFWRSQKSLYCIGEAAAARAAPTTDPARKKAVDSNKPSGVSLKTLLGESGNPRQDRKKK